MLSAMIDVKIIVHHPSNDVDCLTDYDSVSVVVGGEEVIRYGDYYHDAGLDKAEGFVDAFRHICGQENLRIVEERIADGEPREASY